MKSMPARPVSSLCQRSARHLSSRLSRWCGVLALLATTTHEAGAQTTLPADVKPTCTVPAADFAKWFAGGTVTANGLVNPANSVTFNDATACAFYQWAQQMMLWVTSPLGSSYVLNSPVFYDVSLLTDNQRTLIANDPAALKRGGVRRSFHLRGPMGLKIQEKAAGAQSAPSTPSTTSGTDNDVVQAGGGTLLSQVGKQDTGLVYYSIQVNDVYAYFLSMQKNNGVAADKTTFPTTAADRDAVVAYAAKYGVTLPDADALAIEMKTAWVDASTVDASQYITINASVPAYDTTDPTTWKPTGETKPVTLALVGIHIAGSVLGHPELIWATFEHTNNTPNAGYAYVNTSDKITTVAGSTTGSWLFCANGSTGSFNVERANVNSAGVIVGWPTGKTPPKQVIPSDTQRASPWGSLPYTGGGHPDPDVAANNTQIISLNSNIIGMLDPTDVRRNYLQIGSIWTQNGVIPAPDNAPPIKGSQALANTTMETYHQSMSCFGCHNGAMTTVSGLSHIYGALQPLPKPPATPPAPPSGSSN